MSHLIRLADYRNSRKRAKSGVFFNRAELSQLLGLYSEFVARGDWRDYAIDHLSDAAMFSIFRHAHEAPQFTIVKAPDQKRRQGGYLLFHGEKRVNKSQSLGEILEYLRTRPRLVKEH
jgi:hypothetical protein